MNFQFNFSKIIFARKKADLNILLPSSRSPSPYLQNMIPYLLAYRIVRICSKPELRESTFLKLRDFLFSRDYNSSIFDSMLWSEPNLYQKSCFRESGEKGETRSSYKLIISISFNLQLPCISSIIQKHCREPLYTGSLDEGVFSKSTFGCLQD